MNRRSIRVLLLFLVLVQGTSFLTAQTQKVSMVTSKQVNDQISLLVNGGSGMKIDWGDGVLVSTSDIQINGTVKGDTIKLYGNSFWTTLSCDDNAITSLNLSEAPELVSLYCQNNALEYLTITKNLKLRYLNCSNNKLSTLALSRNTDLNYLDCSYNNISGLSLQYNTGLKTLICAGNKLKTLNLNTCPKLTSLWCQDNQLSTLNLSSLTSLISLLCHNNLLSAITLPPSAKITDFWCDKNQFNSLDLSSDSYLQTLSCDSNQLSTLRMPDSGSFYMLSCADNFLGFNSFVDLSRVKDSETNYLYYPQGPFGLSSDVLNIGEDLDLSFLGKNVSETATQYAIRWYNASDNSMLEHGPGKDVRVLAGKSRFYKPFESVYALITSDVYTSLTLKTSVLRVIDPVGIKDALSLEAGLRISVGKGFIHMTAEKEIPVTIYTADSKKVWKGNVGENGTTVSLSKGIYIVNGATVSL